MISCVLSVALAAPSGDLVPKIGARTVKIDLFYLDPRAHPWGSDWKVATLEQWTAVLQCAPVSERTERCTFPEGLWWSAVVAGSTSRESIRLAPPEAIEWTWTPRGRLQSWDVVGDTGAFRTDAVAAVTKLTFRRDDKQHNPDTVRQVGAELEGWVTRGLAGALEFELPKDGVSSEGTWKPTQTPWIARRWTLGTSKPKLEYAIVGTDGSLAELSVSGTVIEQVTVDGSTLTLTAETTLKGTATFDKAVGGLVRAHLETYSRSGSMDAIVGHARSAAVVVPWTPGSPSEPADPPDLLIP